MVCKRRDVLGGRCYVLQAAAQARLHEMYVNTLPQEFRQVFYNV